jgi:hypothetical protein
MSFGDISYFFGTDTKHKYFRQRSIRLGKARIRRAARTASRHIADIAGPPYRRYKVIMIGALSVGFALIAFR